MINLKCLRVAVTKQADFQLQDLLADLPFQLVHFSWMDWRFGCTSKTIPAHLSFISSQHSLQYFLLALSYHVVRNIGPFDHLPKPSTLHTFIGDQITTHFLIPHLLPSQITTLGYLPWTTPNITKSLAPASPTFSNLQTLIFYQSFFLDLNLNTLIEELKSLEVLHLVLQEYSINPYFDVSLLYLLLANIISNHFINVRPL